MEMSAVGCLRNAGNAIDAIPDEAPYEMNKNRARANQVCFAHARVGAYKWEVAGHRHGRKITGQCAQWLAVVL